MTHCLHQVEKVVYITREVPVERIVEKQVIRKVIVERIIEQVSHPPSPITFSVCSFACDSFYMHT